MKPEEHEKAYKEHLENIERVIDENIERNQRNDIVILANDGRF